MDSSPDEIINNVKSEVVSLQKQLDKAFEEASGYSIYKVFKRAQEEEWVKL